MVYKMTFDTTIAAISTAYGESGIGVIRLSGPESLEIMRKIFCPGRVPDPLKLGTFRFRPRYMHYGHIVDPSSLKVLDEALCVYMKAPASYTGEDCCEIQCHGGMMPLREILYLCLRMGAEPASKGEFTKRAFINGRLDLAQAEAVMDLISAGSEKGYKSAVSQVMGSLSERVRRERQNLLDILVDITVNMDYPDEDIEEETLEKLGADLEPVISALDGMLAGSGEGRIIREGISIAIAGKPNVGKSSLMNALLRSDRSIVTPVPGTTRDTIEEKASLGGITVHLTDTAGIRESGDIVESLGIERSRAALAFSDMVLLVMDGSKPFDEEDIKLLELTAESSRIIVLNKKDLGIAFESEELRNITAGGITAVRCSAASGEGLSDLSKAIEEKIYGGLKRTEDPVLTNVRHIDLVRRARESLGQASAMIGMGQALDIIEIDVRQAFDLLGEITGDSASDEVIDAVFERFCLGK